MDTAPQCHDIHLGSFQGVIEGLAAAPTTTVTPMVCKAYFQNIKFLNFDKQQNTKLKRQTYTSGNYSRDVTLQYHITAFVRKTRIDGNYDGVAGTPVHHAAYIFEHAYIFINTHKNNMNFVYGGDANSLGYLGSLVGLREITHFLQCLQKGHLWMPRAVTRR